MLVRPMELTPSVDTIDFPNFELDIIGHFYSKHGISIPAESNDDDHNEEGETFHPCWVSCQIKILSSSF